MTIDILSYELKYKNDRHVIDLLDAYKEAESILTNMVESLIEEDENKALQEAETLQSNLDGMKEDFQDSLDLYKDTILDVLSDLDSIKEFKKADMIEGINDIIKSLEKLGQDMKL